MNNDHSNNIPRYQSQVRTSYVPSEILWGHRFDHDTVTYDQDSAKYLVSFKSLNSSSPDKTPRKSAKDLEEMNYATK